MKGEKKMMKKTEQTVDLKPIKPKNLIVTIEGDTDLVLNKMNDVASRKLIDQRKDKAETLEKPNVWEEIITALHWYKGKPTKFDEKTMKKNLDPKVNAPCITTFGLKKSWKDAVVRNGIDTYSTKFDAGVNLIAKGGCVPITFAEHYIDEKLMSPKKGKPVLVHLNRFTGWQANIHVSMLDTVYSVEQVVNIINLAGFGIGIGSGRTSGYGRYHVIGLSAE